MKMSTKDCKAVEESLTITAVNIRADADTVLISPLAYTRNVLSGGVSLVDVDEARVSRYRFPDLQKRNEHIKIRIWGDVRTESTSTGSVFVMSNPKPSQAPGGKIVKDPALIVSLR